MAATNFTPIQLYFSTTASAVPLAVNLAQGELAINITDGKLYYEDNAGAVQVIATKGAGTIGGSNTQIQYNNAGALAGNAAMVFNNSTNVTTLTTLNLTNALTEIYGGTAQSAYAQGDVLYASATNTLAKLGIGVANYILTSSGSVPQWVAPTSVTVNTATNLAGGVAGSVPYQSGVATTTFLAIGAANRVMTSTGSAPQWVTALTALTGVSSSSITNTSLTSSRVVFSTTAGLQTDDADLTFDGTTLSAGGLSTVGLSTLVKTVKIGDSSFNGVAVFAAATPAKLYMGTGTVTDVTSAISATNTTGAIASLGITPIAATNTGVTYTNASTLYIAGAPSAGTNITITNPYALYVDAGNAYFGGSTVISTTDNTNAALRITQLGTGNALLVEDITNPDASPFLINSGGVVVKGATQAYDTTSSSTPVVQLHGATTNTANVGYAATNWATATGAGSVTLAKSRGGTIGTHLIAADDDNIGVIFFAASDGTAFIPAAQITVSVDGTPGTSDMPGRLTFSTTADGASSVTERMRIDSTGDVGIGTTSPLVKLEVAGSNNTLWIVTASISGTTMDVTAVTSGTIAVGDLVYGANVQPYTKVTALGTGTGGIGSYTVSVSQTVTSSAATYGTTQYGSTLIRITDTDVNQQAGQPTGGLQFFTSDASSPTAGVGAYVAALAESATPDTALVFGTRDNAGGGVDANERMRIDSAGNVGIGATANASAILDAQSTTKGVRMPNMTTTQKNAIASPAAGLMVFDTTLAKLCVYSGSAWQTITSV